MKKSIELARKVANSDTTILILGESGVGKEVLSKAIHSSSNRKTRPFISVNCGALPETLLESELFGHVKGSFTGAIKNKEGLFKAADGGTILLDEIGDTTPAIQVKLLRVLEEKAMTPIGDTKSQLVDVRIITATNANLEQMVKAATFRPDLFYRLNVFPITIPPLRERPGDIGLLANYFVKRHCTKMELPDKELAAETMELLRAYYWPGNIRQLENMLERAVLLAKGNSIMPLDLPELAEECDNTRRSKPGRKQSVSVLDNQPELETLEKAYIYYILCQQDWHKANAAKIHGIDSSTLDRKIERYSLKQPESMEN